MKILYSCLSRSWGGMEMFTLTAIQQLLKRDIQVDLLCYPESRLYIEANHLGIIIHNIKAKNYFHPKETFKLSRIIKNGNYDLIHTQASKDLWVVVPALNLLHSKIPLFLTKQVGSFIIKKDRFHNWIYNRLTYVFAISTVIKNNLIETTPINENKIIIMPNGVDTHKFDSYKIDKNKVRNEFKIKENELAIGMLARFTPGKGHEEFLYAANQLNKKYNNLKFLIIGESSYKENEYEEKIKKLANDFNFKNIIFTGFRSDTEFVLAALDIFVFPSHAEAFGIALIEAMSMGKPSVCSDSDGILDIAIDGKTSLLFKNKDKKDLTEKIDKLIQSEQLRNELGIEARKRAIEYFDVEKLTDKTIEIYNQVKKS